ncbi:MAG: endo alpha-1,4 polygalactosaminidase [Peptococcaceae bacterium]|nr:endo alpha-1,4 polygalactosaminidase [Peptococcaceae bacterium]MDH7523969.1 endo alpha-1,4 polygalactosaminidase [Peptococcaceae bacterium]
MERRKAFAGIRNFALYYGRGRAEELARFDLAVVEPSGQAQASLKTMREAGTLVLAYLSAIEISPGAGEFEALQKEDFLSAGGGVPLINGIYGNRMADLRSERWNRLLRRKASSLLSSGYDGLFLDTIGNVEHPALSPECRDGLIMAAVNLLKEFREEYEGHVFVQNNGLERLCLYTARLVDGICWENPPFAETKSKAWLEAVMNRLKALQEKAGLKVLLLMEGKQPGERLRLAKKAAAENGFLFYRAPEDYLDI